LAQLFDAFFPFVFGYDQQELAAVFKKIGDKQTCTIGLYELYRITQLYPKVFCQVYLLYAVGLAGANEMGCISTTHPFGNVFDVDFTLPQIA
jgi:hypothetical protein